MIKLNDILNEAGGVVTARIQQKPKGYWAVFNKRGQSQFEGDKKFMINILKKASTLSPNAIGSILDRARFGDKHLEFKAQFSRYYYNESVNESDLGLTLKKGKTITVTHKTSGKELVIIDKPNVRKEYEKIGYFVEGNVSEVLTRGGAIELQGQAKYLAQGLKDMTKSYKKKDWAQMEEEVDYIVTKAKMMGDIVKQKRYQESVNESGIMYRAGVKKYGLEGMKKIQSAAGKGLGHAEIGKIKDKYDKKRKKSESVDEGSMEKNFKWAKGKELKAIEMMIDMEAEGISAVVKNYKKNPKAFKQFVKDISRMKGMNEEVTKGRGVQKIFDIHKNGYGKLGGRMLDSLSAGLFVQLYDKAPDNIKEKMNGLNEKKLYVVIGKMWDKFGSGVSLR